MCRVLFILLLLTPRLCTKAQDSCQPVKGEIIKTLSKSEKLHSNDTFYYAQNEFIVSFVGSFEDSVRIYIGNNLVYNGFLSTYGGPGHPRQNIRIPFKNTNDQPLMKIHFVNKNTCLTESLLLIFSILEVRAGNRWYLTYTNNFASLE